MRNLKEWFSANELKDLEGLSNSPQGINKRARTQNWEKREKDGVQGGALEYHYTSLPENVQKQLGFEPTERQRDTEAPLPRMLFMMNWCKCLFIIHLLALAHSTGTCTNPITLWS